MKDDNRNNVVAMAIYTAAAAALGNLAVSYANGQNELKVEALRSEQALVLEAIKTGGNTEEAAENLKFLVKAGLLKERGADISKALNQGSIPVLPAAGGQQGVAVNKPTHLENNAPSLKECLLDLHISIPGESTNSPITGFAIRSFQKQHGLKMTSVFDDATLARAKSICRLDQVPKLAR